MPTPTELLNAMKSYATGLVAGNTADTLGGPVDIVNQAISPLTKAIGIYSDDPIGGSKQFRRMMNLPEENRNIAETAGSLLSPGGAVQAMIVGAGRLGRAQKFMEADMQAEFALGKKASAADLFNQTGVYEEKGKLKSVISDSASKVDTQILDAAKGNSIPIASVFSHPEVFKLYPELTKVSISKATLPGDVRGRYVPDLNEVVISDKVTDPEEIRSIILHEAQHKIQDLEGFQRGGSLFEFIKFNPDTMRTKLNAALKSADTGIQSAAQRFGNRANEKLAEAHNRYLNLAGEQEARFTQATMNLSENEVNSKVLKTLRAGDTPANVDTRPIRPIP